MSDAVHLTLPSSDGEHELACMFWSADSPPKGVVQLIHGMTEYVGRYDDFAKYLNTCGFHVIGHDHIAHGKTAASPDEWGVYEVGRGGDVMIEDVQRVREYASTQCAALPYFMLGHSMGSFILRNYLASHAGELAGAIVCGTGEQPAALASFGHALAVAMARIKGPAYRSAFINNMGVGGYNKAFEPARTSYDWLSCDEAIVDAYCADPACTFMFSVSGYAELTGLVGRAVSRKTYAAVPHTLPILVISGGRDAVGDFGKAPRSCADTYRGSGVEDVTCAVFEESRHEVLNDIEKDVVRPFISNWLIDHLSSAQGEG